MRLALVLLVVCACDEGGGKRAERAPKSPPTPRVDATPPDARDNLLKDLPPIHGELSGVPFTPVKAYLWVSPRGAELSFYGKAEGGPCEHQFAPGDDDLYLSIRFPAKHAKAGGGVWSETEGALVTWKKPSFDYVKDALELVLDTYDEAAGKTTGRVRVTGEDGTRVEGAFDAALCVSPQRDLPPGELHGLRWLERPHGDRLPTDVLAAIHLGDRITPAAVELVDKSISLSMQHELHIWRDPPPKPCTLDMGTGFNLALGDGALSTGTAVESNLTITHPPGRPFAVVTWQEPVGAQGMEGSARVVVQLDEIDDEVRGRVFAAFDDPARSMVSGAFTATRCR